METKGKGKKQDGTDNEEELQVQDGDEMPSSSGGAGSKDDQNDDGMFVFKGTISPNAKVNKGEESRERRQSNQPLSLRSPKLAWSS